MKSGALILGIVVSALLLAAAGVLYSIAGSGSGQVYRASIDGVRQIEQLSSSWSVEVARVKADPLADFDSLAAFIPRMARLKESLSDAAAPHPRPPRPARQRRPGLPERRRREGGTASSGSRPATRWCATPRASCRSRRQT